MIYPIAIATSSHLIWWDRDTAHPFYWIDDVTYIRHQPFIGWTLRLTRAQRWYRSPHLQEALDKVKNDPT